MKNPCAKGKEMERAACEFLRELGFRARRNARNGLSESDLDCADDPVLARVHLEIKSDKKIGLGTKALDEAMWQATEDAEAQDEQKRCAVLWMEYRCGWRLTWYLEGIQVTTDRPDRIKCALIDLARWRGEEGKP